MAPQPGPALTGVALFVMVAAMSTGAILIRLVEGAGPLAIAFHRLAFGALLLAPWAWARHREELRSLGARRLAVLVLTGVALAAHFATWVTSLGLTTVASSVVLVTMHPAMVAVLSLLLLGEGMALRGWTGLVLALAGAVVLVGGDVALRGDAVLGDALALAGALFMGLYLLSGRRERQRLSLPAYALVVYASAAAALLVFAVGAGESVGPFAGSDYALFLAMALGPQLLGHTVGNWVLRWVPAPVVSTAIVGEPVGSTLLALLVLGEVPPQLALVGGVVILAGVVLVARGQRSRTAAAAP